MKTIIVDLDGTICEERPTFERSLAEILPGAKETINRWRSAGNTIIIYTTRSWSEYRMTEDWLRKNGVEYDQLVCGKPLGQVWIDDRALRFTSWDEISKMMEAAP